jgi:acetyltransferase
MNAPVHRQDGAATVPRGAAPVDPGDVPAALLRDATPDDLPALQRFMQGLSLASRTQRFFAPLRELPRAMVDALRRQDPAHRWVVATVADEPVALGQLVRHGGPGQCELALVVADRWQARGIGRRLLESLLDGARAGGLRLAVIETTWHNEAMRRLALRLGFSLGVHPEDARLLRGERHLA